MMAAAVEPLMAASRAAASPAHGLSLVVGRVPVEHAGGEVTVERGLLTGDELAAWVASEQPRLGVHQFSLAGLPELLRAELLYALQQRDQAPPPLDPTEVRILFARLGRAASLSGVDVHGDLKLITRRSTRS